MSVGPNRQRVVDVTWHQLTRRLVSESSVVEAHEAADDECEGEEGPTECHHGQRLGNDESDGDHP